LVDQTGIEPVTS